MGKGSLKVGVLGAAGRMGQSVCSAVMQAESLELVAAVDLVSDESEEMLEGIPITQEISDFFKAEVDVVVDFTIAEASKNNLPLLAEEGIDVVVGTSGLSDQDFSIIEKKFNESSCLIVPNFAIGAVLMMHFASIAAPWFNTAEIIEYHHNQKKDSPSGTAIATAERMSSASNQWDEDPTINESIAGSRGAKLKGIPIHAVRMKGMVAHQEVIMGSIGQTLTIRHDSPDRESFMPGVLLAVQGVASLPNGLTIGLEKLLGIE
ncbi:MAG: 4-hydroxy-tetrahydrodipicolinate reductase [Acidimicrobiales bacterium]|jgi:4-hydroxy-tetrahydrodipicolinate reductase|nr:4-hydroxy-tetrahydrodipicolinate reductase [Acidimicrobiales bacterium]